MAIVKHLAPHLQRETYKIRKNISVFMTAKSPSLLHVLMKITINVSSTNMGSENQPAIDQLPMPE